MLEASCDGTADGSVAWAGAGAAGTAVVGLVKSGVVRLLGDVTTGRRSRWGGLVCGDGAGSWGGGE